MSREGRLTLLTPMKVCSARLSRGPGPGQAKFASQRIIRLRPVRAPVGHPWPSGARWVDAARPSSELGPQASASDLDGGEDGGNSTESSGSASGAHYRAGVDSLRIAGSEVLVDGAQIMHAVETRCDICADDPRPATWIRSVFALGGVPNSLQCTRLLCRLCHGSGGMRRAPAEPRIAPEMVFPSQVEVTGAYILTLVCSKNG